MQISELLSNSNFIQSVNIEQDNSGEMFGYLADWIPEDMWTCRVLPPGGDISTVVAPSDRLKPSGQILVSFDTVIQHKCETMIMMLIHSQTPRLYNMEC